MYKLCKLIKSNFKIFSTKYSTIKINNISEPELSNEIGESELILSKSLSRSSFTDSNTFNVVKVPALGKNITRCKIYKWLKKPGDYVNLNDLLCIIETDLIFGKVYSKVTGTIIESVHQEGCTVNCGSDLMVLMSNGIMGPNYQSSRIFTDVGKRFYSTSKLTKYIPMISFPSNTTTEVVSSNKVSTGDTGKTSGPMVLDDYYKSPYRLWFRNLSEDEIDTINHGTIDTK